MCDKPRRFL